MRVTVMLAPFDKEIDLQALGHTQKSWDALPYRAQYNEIIQYLSNNNLTRAVLMWGNEEELCNVEELKF